MNNKKRIEDYLTSDYIYLPYYDGMKVLVKDKEYINKNELILYSDDKKVNSSVSGNVLGLTKINNTKYIVIENDFKDKLKTRMGVKRNLSDYTKEEFLCLVKEYGLDTFSSNSKVLVINGIDEYMGEVTYDTLLKEYTIEILDTIDALIDIMNIKKCFLAMNNSDIECVNNMLNNIGTYPKIDLKLFSNDFSIGIKSILVNKLTNYKHKNYDVMYLNIKDVLNMYNILRRKRPMSETFITLTGDNIDYTKVVRVKIGTNLVDVLNYFNIDKDKHIIINGLLNGISLKNNNFIIDHNVRSIFVSDDVFYKESNCINCGECISACPIHINPRYMYFNNNKKSKSYKEKCIGCGICSYVCPSKINLHKGVVYNDKK